MLKPYIIIIITLLVASLATKQGESNSVDESINHVFCICDNTTGNYTADSQYQANLKTLLTTLVNQASLPYQFYNASAGVGGPEQVYGQYYCSGDVGFSLCATCLHDASRHVLDNCMPYKSAIVWYRECTLRYSSRSMVSIHHSDDVMSWSYTTERHVTDRRGFPGAYRATMKRLINESAYGDGFSRMAEGSCRVSERETVFCQVQCSPDLNRSQCDTCLTSLVNRTGPEIFGLPALMCAFYPNCQMMYKAMDSWPLAPQGSPPLSQPPGKKNTHLIALYIALPVAMLFLLSALGFCVYRKTKRHFSYDNLVDIKSVESLKYDISTIRSATHNFSPSFKLGQGGFGSVYKGKLQDGQEIAVKRLLQKSQEEVEEFKNEVLFIAKLQHRNLVKLLGYCLTAKEKLLILEFLPNISLDKFLNDAAKRACLDWKTRYKIILGVARGILYLHEDSRLKIIHRDLKPQNILLDEAMNPKISDFGLAKSFNLDQSIANTHTIVGTYGYMSPEYAITGHFSTKSDVYSFGVIILEIVSGKKNIIQENHPGLFHQTWKLWTEGNALHIIDPALNNTCSAEEALACIHIGLLCIQEEPGSRPTMAKVVSVLNGHSSTLPEPSPPLIFTFNEDGSEIKYSSVMISHDMSDEQHTQDKQQQN